MNVIKFRSNEPKKYVCFFSNIGGVLNTYEIINEIGTITPAIIAQGEFSLTSPGGLFTNFKTKILYSLNNSPIGLNTINFDLTGSNTILFECFDEQNIKKDIANGFIEIYVYN